jgi:trehalose 6-phosphate phosphatase
MQFSSLVTPAQPAPQAAEIPNPATVPGLPPLTDLTALFLDFDGTLVDIASQPELVEVPADLADLLASLSQRLGGALAVVSGRTMADLDVFLAPLKLPLAAEHGAAQRWASGSQSHVVPPDLRDVIHVATALAAEHPGLRVEIKSAAVALHYRHAPELEALCLEAILEAVKRTAGVELMKGKLVFEVKPAGVSKGTAIEAFMLQPPFTGRVPLFAGDDTTDEHGFTAVQTLGGQGIKVGQGPSHAELRCASPRDLRQWLQGALASLKD